MSGNTNQIRTGGFATRTTAIIAAFSVLALGAATASAGGPGLKLGSTKPKGGTSVVTIDPATATALTGLGVTTGVTAPATAVTGGVSFPITGGSIVYAKVTKRDGTVIERRLGGWISHSGAITFTKGSTTVSLGNPRIVLAAHMDGSVQANVNGSRARVDVFRLVAPKVDSTDKSISATVKLTRQSAAALNKAFDTTSLSTATTVGTVKITPTF